MTVNNTNTNTNGNQPSNCNQPISLRISSMDLIDFSTKLQEGVQQGFELDFSNENCPIQLGTLFTCCLLKYQQEPSKVEQSQRLSQTTTTPTTTTEEPKVSRGRKPGSKAL